MMLDMPIVAIITATAGWPESGRKTVRSTNMARIEMTASDIKKATTGGNSNVTAAA